jgi:isoleucyl-tRNA synthetase
VVGSVHHMWPRCSTSALPAVRAAANDACAICASTLLRRQLHSSRRLKASLPVSTANDKAYAKTLLLPKTDFPLRADAVNREKLFRKKTTESLYKWQVRFLQMRSRVMVFAWLNCHSIQWAQKERPLFVLHDGPPYANGSVHTGTIYDLFMKISS